MELLSHVYNDGLTTIELSCSAFWTTRKVSIISDGEQINVHVKADGFSSARTKCYRAHVKTSAHRQYVTLLKTMLMHLTSVYGLDEMLDEAGFVEV